MMVMQYSCNLVRRYVKSQISILSRNIPYSVQNGPIARKRHLHNNANACQRNVSQSTVTRKSLPSITEFSNCTDYLQKSLENRNFDIISEDWEYLLDQIVETLPATSELSKLVKPFHCHSFALGICAEVGNTSAAVALIEYMKRSDEEITDIHRKFVLKAYENHLKVSSNDDSYWSSKTLSASEKLIESDILNICNDITKNASSIQITSNYSQIDLLISVANTLVHTTKWLEGYNLWNKLIQNDGTNKKVCTGAEPRYLKDESTPIFGRLHRTAYSLANVALINDREDIFWTILNDSSFHNNHVYIRHGVNHDMLKKNEDIFEKYLRYCKKKYVDSPNEEADAISKLFEYMRAHFILISLEFFRVLEDILSETQPKMGSEIISGVNEKCVRVKQNKFGGPTKCKNCLQPISSPHLSQKDIDLLKENIMSKLILKDDVYLSTNPSELRMFDAVLAKSGSYDIIVDGLNVCGLAGNNRNDDFKKEKDYYTKEKRIDMGYRRHQEFILQSVLEKLNERGLKPLLIHRKYLKKYRNIKEINKLCQYVILETTSNDDPFFIAAALNSGPKTYILTNDMLRQHNNGLEDPYLQRIFSYWQMLAQVKCKWLVFKTDHPNNKGIFNANDNTFRKVMLYFPDNRVIRATRNTHGWHIPITGNMPRQNEGGNVPLTMIRPTDWACISK